MTEIIHIEYTVSTENIDFLFNIHFSTWSLANLCYVDDNFYHFAHLFFMYGFFRVKLCGRMNKGKLTILSQSIILNYGRVIHIV